MNAPQGTLMFRVTTEQLETAGDWLILLSYTRMMRIGRIMGPMVTIFLALAGFVQFREGNPSMFFLYMILTLYVGMTIIRKTSGGDPAAAVQANRQARQKAAEAGRYNGELPFRIELEGKECRIYFDGSQPHQIFDCRTFRTAVECDEIVWITGKRMAGLPLPKAQLEGSPGDLRRWLKPYVAIWYTCPIPEKLKAAVTGQEVAD